MNDLQGGLRRRFPLLASLRLLYASGETEDLATFMGVLLAAMERSHDSPFCFIFPRKCGLAPLSATLYALGRFAVDFPALAERYAQAGFTCGQRIKLVPEDKVFEFGGIWPGIETYFRLKLLDDKRNTAFNWPITEILRIEPTAHKIPKGREADIHIAHKTAPLSPLDKLIGTRTFGNPSLAVNYVLYLGGRTEVEGFLAANSLSNQAGDIRATLDQLVVSGIVGETGEIRQRDSYQSAGQPLIAIGSRIESVAEACTLAPARSKVVVVDGAKRITDLAKFDAIAASQNLIILAEPDEEEKLQQFHNRGCRFWRFSRADLEMGGPQTQSGQFFKDVFRAARNEEQFRTEVLPCRNPNLEEVTRSLETCQATLDESETDETQRILRQLYGLLVRCTSCLAPPHELERAQFIEKAEKILAAAQDRMMWLPAVATSALNDACAAILRAICDPELGKVKGDALRKLLAELQRKKITAVAVIARSVPNRTSINQWLESEGFSCPVLLPAEASENGFFERLICTSWPGSGKFGRVVRKFVAAEICLIAYPFEGHWLYSFGEKQRNSQTVPNLSAQEKSVFLGLSDEAAWPAGPEPAATKAMYAPSHITPRIDLEEWMTRKGMVPVGNTAEETVPATLVNFSGDSYAFLTDTFQMPVITDLVSGIAAENYKIPRRRLAEIHAGDALVFRESGRRDVIQALADAQLGAEAPIIRNRAAQWHRALRESSLDEAVLTRQLEEVNCPRTCQTVRAWLADDSMIGPHTKADLEAIAYAVGDQRLLENVQCVWAAIQLLRSAHLSAGMRLSKILLEKLPQRLGEINEGRTRIEIDNATSAWVVQVENISDRTGPHPRSQVNSLLWDADDLF